MYLPRCRADTTSPMMAWAPTISPPAPTPWIARKAMSSAMDWDRPDSTEPTRKITMASWKSALRP